MQDAADDGPGTIVVVIPAHDEEDLIGEALESLAAQTRVADEVIVVADRCSDETKAIAIAHNVAAVVTFRNRDKKAGAINQVLAELLPRLSDNDAVLLMDADTSLSPEFIAEAARRLREPEGKERRTGAVGGIFLGYPLAGVVGNLQNNEFIRYAREIGRRQGRADVLTGTGSLFSVRALRDVEAGRASGRLPPGGIYDVAALTEDNELTLALKHLGYVCASPRECTAGTELMRGPRTLFHQRLRWQRGALENLRSYGVTRWTLPYLFRQALTYAAVAFVPFFTAAFAYGWLRDDSVPWSWFWIGVTAFVLFERVWSVKRGGWRAIGLAATILPEVVYDMFLHIVYVKALVDTATRAPATWDRTDHARTAAQRVIATLREVAAVGSLLLAAVAAGLVCAIAGIAWTVIGAFVLTGAALAALRLTGLDPLGVFLRSGELAAADASAAPQGFGGLDVPADL